MTRRSPARGVVPSTIAIVALVAATVVAVGRPAARAWPALDLSDDGVYGPAVIRNTQGETLLSNFRTVEAGVLYRASAFRPEAFRDAQAFSFLRDMKIGSVVSLDNLDNFYAEEGYLRYWARQTGHPIDATSLPVAPDHAYARDDRSGLHAAAELLEIMKSRRPDAGAVLLHGEAGKDAVGVAAAAYEVWRTLGRDEARGAWSRSVRRYLVSNVLVPNESPVRPEWLERLRGDLEFLAQL
jgi:hypothetical protein